MITIYYATGTCSLASHIALEESGLRYEARSISFPRGENREPDYLAINPRGKVPALVLDGRVLTENVAILRFIAQSAPEAGLWPAAAWDEAQCLSRMAWYSNSVHPCFTRFARPGRFSDDPGDHEAISARGKDDFWAMLGEVDELLQQNEWTGGSQYTVCDPYTLIFYEWGLKINLPVHERKAYTHLKDRMLTRPAVVRVLEREQSPLLS